MCSVNTDSLQEMIPITTEIFPGTSATCRKCGGTPVEVVLRKTDPYCRACFLTYVTHKFRSCIGKHKLVPVGAEVLVCTSGGLASSALLHLVHEGVTLTSLKKLRVQPAFLHVDERCASAFSRQGENAEQSSSSSFAGDAEYACRAVVQLGYPCYYTTLEAILSPVPIAPLLYKRGSSVEVLHQQSTSAVLQRHLQQLLTDCSSSTARESVVRVLLQRSLAVSCSRLGYTRLFAGHSATQVAVTILSDVAEGRGAHTAQHVNFRHVDSDSGVEVFRPLREVLEDELLHYLTINDIPYTRQKHTVRQPLWSIPCLLL
uniref:Cytoplasmic tRNA 2-thiolation protein 2-like n=1 Tax=Hirondellea gigas TaxID=1518452 RepID=A0A2P2I8Z4_9CRUS